MPAMNGPAGAEAPLVGLIPAAGRGVRAYPYTAAIPKSMLEVDGVPLVERNLLLLRDEVGVAEIVIVIGHCGEVIRAHLGDGERFGLRLTYVVNDRIDLELPYSVYLASRHIQGPCCMVLADECYIESNHRELRAALDPTAHVTCAVTSSDNPKQIRKNYAVELRDGVIVRLQEKPRSARVGLMGTGTYVLHPEVFARLRDAYAGGIESGPRDWTTWLDALCTAGLRVVPFALRGGYVNVNSRDDLNYANYALRSRTFADRLKSLVYIIDDETETAVRPIAQFAEQPELDEVVVVARRDFPALARRAADPKVRAVFSGLPDTPAGDLVRLGLDSARGAILVLTYSDDTFVPSDVAKLLVYLRDADMVVGTRTTRQMIEQGANMRGLIRAVHVALAKLVELLWWRFETRFTDICCVYRALWRSTYHAVRGNLTSRGVEIFPELVIEVLRARKRIIEIPVNYYNRDVESPYVRSRYQRADTLWGIVRMIGRKRLQGPWRWE